MYWALDFQVPQVEQVLSRDSFSLEDVLDEEDTLQEVKTLNHKVIEYFLRPEIITQLVQLAAGPIPPDADTKRQQKFPYVASEILSCDVRELMTAVLSSDELLDILFGFFSLPPPAQTLRVAFACKIIVSLLIRKPREVCFVSHIHRFLILVLVMVVYV